MLEFSHSNEFDLWLIVKYPTKLAIDYEYSAKNRFSFVKYLNESTCDSMINKLGIIPVHFSGYYKTQQIALNALKEFQENFTKRLKLEGFNKNSPKWRAYIAYIYDTYRVIKLSEFIEEKFSTLQYNFEERLCDEIKYLTYEDY